MTKMLSLLGFAVALAWQPTFASENSVSAPTNQDEVNVLDELNPFDPNIEEKLNQLDEVYERETGLSAHLEDPMVGIPEYVAASCYRASCPVWARVVKSQQRMYLYVNGALQGTYAVSTGMRGFTTPNFDRHPNGRIYDRYTSTKYPGGDWNGMGNMPYAVFIQGGFAIHGTGRSNWANLGRVASHGCIRLHPDNGYTFNRLVRRYGIRQTWITVQ